jgi:hypothetical protein
MITTAPRACDSRLAAVLTRVTKPGATEAHNDTSRRLGLSLAAFPDPAMHAFVLSFRTFTAFAAFAAFAVAREDRRQLTSIVTPRRRWHCWICSSVLRRLTSELSHLHLRADDLQIVVEVVKESFMPGPTDEHTDVVIRIAPRNRCVQQVVEGSIWQSLTSCVLKIVVRLPHAVRRMANVVDVDGRPRIEIAPVKSGHCSRPIHRRAYTVLSSQMY